MCQLRSNRASTVQRLPAQHPTRSTLPTFALQWRPMQRWRLVTCAVSVLSVCSSSHLTCLHAGLLPTLQPLQQPSIQPGPQHPAALLTHPTVQTRGAWRPASGAHARSDAVVRIASGHVSQEAGNGCKAQVPAQGKACTRVLHVSMRPCTAQLSHIIAAAACRRPSRRHRRRHTAAHSHSRRDQKPRHSCAAGAAAQCRRKRCRLRSAAGASHTRPAAACNIAGNTHEVAAVLQ